MKGHSILNVLLVALLIWGSGTAVAQGAEANAVLPVVEQVDINTADAATLERILKGVGRSRAEAIVAYREAHGHFYSAEELTAVKGIGSSTVSKNAERIVLE